MILLFVLFFLEVMLRYIDIYWLFFESFKRLKIETSLSLWMDLGHFGGFWQMGFPSLWGPGAKWRSIEDAGYERFGRGRTKREFVQTPQFGVVVEAILRLKCYQHSFGVVYQIGQICSCLFFKWHWNRLKLDNFLHGSASRNLWELFSVTLLQVATSNRSVDTGVLASCISWLTKLDLSRKPSIDR